ncbi:MAG: CarD family transcriptional regulator [bacterium]|nr:CarD family transcriptional regulator [bacterium]
MFQKGEYVVYGVKGVCEVQDITCLNMQGIPKDRKYYVLRPCSVRDNTIFIPVDGEKKSVLRAIMTRKEAETFVDSIPQVEEIRVHNEKQREAQYKEAIQSCECREWLRVIKTLYFRKQKRMAEGRKTTAMDEKYLRLAESNLQQELSMALGISKEELEVYLSKYYEQQRR